MLLGAELSSEAVELLIGCCTLWFHPLLVHVLYILTYFSCSVILVAFGTILFSFGGASTFPTIQTDMRKASRFPLSVFWAYIGVISMYLPVSVLGFLAYGKDISPNILDSVGHNDHNTSSITLDIVLALITVHLLFSFVIVLNPVSQQFEELLSIPQSK